MSPTSNAPTKVCPTCGTRVSENASRCLVCGRTLTPTAAASGTAAAVSTKSLQGPRMPELTLSLPVALGLMILVLAIGAAVVFTFLRSTGQVTEPTPTATTTLTPTITLSPSPSPTGTTAPTQTPLPPVEYEVKPGDVCSSIAGLFGVSVNSIVMLNNLPADCGMLSVGQKLLIPAPTPTASPMPTSTLNAGQATESACEKADYTVGPSDTLGGIAGNYQVSMDAIKSFNNLTSDTVFEGQKLTIPLCQRVAVGTTPTPTVPPPYPAPNLLLPADGASFTVTNETITLQWASVGDLRQNEAYAVTVEDVTQGDGERLVEYTTDTKFILPASFQPAGDTPHIIRWSVVPARQSSTDEEGQAVWEPAGTTSVVRVFSWWGGSGEATPTP